MLHDLRSVIYEGQLIEKQKGIAEAFNGHFTMIGPKLAEKIVTKESDNPLKYFADEDASTIPNFFNFKQLPQTM